MRLINGQSPTRLSNNSLGRDSLLTMSKIGGKISSQHKFKLRDLPIYSKTLKYNKKKDGQKMDQFSKTVLGRKY